MLSMEFIPKQKDQDFEMIAKWLDKIHLDFIIIPDSPNLKSTPEASIVALIFEKKLGIQFIPSIAGSGRREERIESLLLGLKYSNIFNVAVVGGDCSGMGEIDGVGLAKKAKNILGEESLIICGSKGTIDLANKKNLEAKISNGANLIITQPIFHPKTAQKFLKDFEDVAKGSKVEAMIGFFPIYEERFCIQIRENNLGFDIPLGYQKDIAKNPFESNLKLYEEMKAICPHIHISGAKNNFLNNFISFLPSSKDF
ncbi:methylenetetrahydrofolate reductase [Helicobacter sp. 11S03491-1]|uniref:methylenetetrahydrofolate reductase n=1 Tax=Helicobacter sp. 11S03491-1 TaxID=1476196 RepID=UPI000BA75A6B|nr:methylenetetrahydrofolate reductase [Helicobacter sp. 11S03491-1]PAF41981.1 hypothetical protein BKH45_05200 [Helicobacter sp. 11S03491-1]